jgi:hypothetical protein
VGLLAVCDSNGTPAGNGKPGVLSDRHGALVRARLSELRRSCDWVVLSYHGGEEYAFEPMPSRRRRLHGYLAAGAHVVVAHHAHVVQGWETTPSGIVFFGLGNFVLDHPALHRFPGTDVGLLIRLSFSRMDVQFEPLFTWIDRGSMIVGAGPPAPTFERIASRGRRARWCRDAYRLRTLPRTAPAPRSSIRFERTFAGRVAGTLRLLATGVRLARQPGYRSQVLGALEHRIRIRMGWAAQPTADGPDIGGGWTKPVTRKR